jgi:hypothetical protein
VLPYELLDFWQWVGSDLVNNTARGRLAEYIVARALQIPLAARQEWTECDLQTASGVKIEVKSAAYIQSWHQNALSDVRFGVGSKRSWDPANNQTSTEASRCADVYVFALLGHRDKTTVDPLELSQWSFLVASARLLDDYFPHQQSVSLKAVEKLSGPRVQFGELAERVKQIMATVSTVLSVQRLE